MKSENNELDIDTMINDIGKRLDNIEKDALENKLEARETFMDNLYDMNTFFIELSTGNTIILPVTHPDYYKGKKEVSLINSYSSQTSTVEIEGKKYDVNSDTFNKIEDYVKNNFAKLIEIAKKQVDQAPEGSYENIHIKIGGIFIMISPFNITDKEDKDFVSSFEETIITMITSKN